MFADRPRSGRPLVTSVRQDNYVRQRHLRDRFVTAESTSRLVVGKHGRLSVDIPSEIDSEHGGLDAAGPTMDLSLRDVIVNNVLFGPATIAVSVGKT